MLVEYHSQGLTLQRVMLDSFLAFFLEVCRLFEQVKDFFPAEVADS
jgi:hypothetical protein